MVAQAGERELEVSILGSRREPFQRVELERRLRAWRLNHPDAHVDVVDE